mmetsp:Transcript_75940/g.245931  ORF Transcript_75940/g.245931 Transcript_75940/m.245931 type:complete len:216 (+) Transcript_75940:152-799(+)
MMTACRRECQTPLSVVSRHSVELRRCSQGAKASPTHMAASPRLRAGGGGSPLASTHLQTAAPSSRISAQIRSCMASSSSRSTRRQARLLSAAAGIAMWCSVAWAYHAGFVSCASEREARSCSGSCRHARGSSHAGARSTAIWCAVAATCRSSTATGSCSGGRTPSSSMHPAVRGPWVCLSCRPRSQTKTRCVRWPRRRARLMQSSSSTSRTSVPR